MEAVLNKGGIKAYFYQGEELVINLLGEIGWDFYTPEFIEVLSRYKDEKIKLNIYSVGGNALDALAVYDFVKANGIKMTAYVHGLCASAATLFACASQKVYMGENSAYLIHNVTQWGEENDSTKMLSERYANIYAKKTGKTAEEMLDLMSEDKLITAQAALELGLVDEIIKPVALAAAFNQNFKETKTHKTMAESKPTLLDKALAFLGLAGKSEDEITAFLDSDENKVVAKSELDSIVAKRLEEFQPEADPKLAELEATHAQFNSAIDALTDKFVALIARVESLESDQEAVQEIVEEAEEKTADKIKAVADKINAISVEKPFKEAPKADASAVVETNKEGEDEQPNAGVLASYEDIKARIDARRK